MVDVNPIRTEADYDAALARIDQLMDVPEGSPEEDELDILTDLVELYESRHYPMGLPSVAAAIEFRMDQEKLSAEDLTDIAPAHEIAGILSGERLVTLGIAQAFHERLGISYDVLLQESSLATAATGQASEQAP